MRFTILRTIEWTLLIVPIILTIIGIVTIYSITYANPPVIHLTFDQIIFAVIGLGLLIFFTFLDYRLFRTLAFPLYLTSVILLIAVHFWGMKIYGATRWIDFGFFQLQPSELFKLFSIMLLAKFFTEWANITLRKLIFLAILFLPPFWLILKEPDFGTAIIVGALIVFLLWYSPIRRLYLAIAGSVLVVLTPVIWFLLHNYQRSRILAFINPDYDPSGAGYNVRQSIIAIGSGGILGRGLGYGSQSQLNFLPVAWTDFIFAGWAEGAGFIGAVVLIGLIVLLIWRAVNVARVSKDNFGMYLALGIAAVILVQSSINIGMNLRLMPVTGIPLPFVSYGGTSLITMLSSIGILESIYLRHKKITF